jgi:hypothetical protein
VFIACLLSGRTGWWNWVSLGPNLITKDSYDQTLFPGASYYLFYGFSVSAQRGGMETVSVAEKSGNEGLLRPVYSYLSRFYASIHEYGKAIDYGMKKYVIGAPAQCTVYGIDGGIGCIVYYPGDVGMVCRAGRCDPGSGFPVVHLSLRVHYSAGGQEYSAVDA